MLTVNNADCKQRLLQTMLTVDNADCKQCWLWITQTIQSTLVLASAIACSVSDWRGVSAITCDVIDTCDVNAITRFVSAVSRHVSEAHHVSAIISFPLEQRHKHWHSVINDTGDVRNGHETFSVAANSRGLCRNYGWRTSHSTHDRQVSTPLAKVYH